MSNTTSTNTTVADRLRAAADLIDRYPDLPTPMVTAYATGTVEVDWFTSHDEDQPATLRQIRRTIGGTWEKVPSGTYFTLRTEVDGLRLSIIADREQVCEAVVVGQETVTVPAVEAAPERTETRDVIEWRCEPLAGESVSA